MSGIHLTFDLLAWIAGMTSGVLVYRWRLGNSVEQFAVNVGIPYFASLLIGAIAGSYLLGTLNLYFSGIPGLGRSILGAIVGAILFIEIYKLNKGMNKSTGWLFVIPLTVSIAVGRVGCFLSGITDFTHGNPSNLPWAVDFGDGILRHPVQLYESISLLLFLLVALLLLKYRQRQFITAGFYLWVLVYASQRFVWEFFKPYGPVIWYLNIFHLICIGLIIYSIIMLKDHRSPIKY